MIGVVETSLDVAVVEAQDGERNKTKSKCEAAVVALAKYFSFRNNFFLFLDAAVRD